jgi:sugar lactone lactonase YvrE
MPDRTWRWTIPWLTLALGIPIALGAQEGLVPFSSPRWNLIDADVSEYLGRTCLSGAALLNDVDFQDGVIEVDLAVSGRRSYPGIIFRVQSEANHERVYVRPHRAGLYPDAVQYTPVINDVAGWQLYNGSGYTAGAEIPSNQWTPLRLDVKGTQARLFLGAGADPVLEINRLEHGVSRGTIGLLGPKDGTACFSNFRYRLDDGLAFEPPPPVESPGGVITDWEISGIFKAARANRSVYPRFTTLFYIGWDKVTAEPSGLVDLARYRQRTPGGADGVLARTVIRSERRQDITLHFGYSDEIDVFLNGHKVFAGNSTYQFRDPSFLGIVGYDDALTLTLEKGLNEIFMFVVENSHGWGFKAHADGELLEPVKDHSGLMRVWETSRDLLTPESVVYDPVRQILYVTNFDNWYQDSAPRTGYISTISLDGEILEQRWVTGLDSPAGAGLWQDKLFVLERGVLTEIATGTGTIVARYPIPDSEFANDLAIDAAGNIYISDTRPSAKPDSRIYRFRDGQFEVWMDGDVINWANGLFVYGNELLVGNSGDGKLKAIDLTTKRVRDIICLGARVLDGIGVDGAGNYLVSHWEGQLYRITPSGEVVEILDLAPEGLNTAAFEYLPDRNLLVMPTFGGNQVVAYRLQ